MHRVCTKQRKCSEDGVEETDHCKYLFLCGHCVHRVLTLLLCYPPQAVALVMPDITRPAKKWTWPSWTSAPRLISPKVFRCLFIAMWRGGSTPSGWVTWQCPKPGSPGSAGLPRTGDTRWCKATVVDPVPSALLAMSTEALGCASKSWLPEQSLGAADSLYEGQDCGQMAPDFEELHWEIKTELTPPTSAVGAESAFFSHIPHVLLPSSAIPDNIIPDNATPSPRRLAAIPSSPQPAPPVTFPPPPFGGPAWSAVCSLLLSASLSSPQLPICHPSQKPSDKSLFSASCAYLSDILYTPFFYPTARSYFLTSLPRCPYAFFFFHIILSDYFSVSFSPTMPAWVICFATSSTTAFLTPFSLSSFHGTPSA